MPTDPPDVPVIVRARPLWQRVLAGITLAGLVTGAGIVFGAGRTAESMSNSIQDHDQRLDKIETRVDGIERTVPLQIQTQLDSIQRDAAETKKDVREIREWLRPRQPR